MSALNEQQFAKYSALHNPRSEYDALQPQTHPLPASMERHAPGEYQPTLPGMEKMLPGEMTHVNAVFKHPVEAERYTYHDGSTGLGEVPGSNWYGLTNNYHPAQVRARASTLRPSQDWLDDNYLHSEPHTSTIDNQGLRPKVESIRGKNVIQDGHHRAAREILAGAKQVDVDRWGREKDYK